jgi:hypothetical protein
MITVTYASNGRETSLAVGDGYVLTCQTTPYLTVEEKGLRRQVQVSEPMRDYLLNGVYQRSSGCDAVFCQRGGDFSVDFVEYKQVGTAFKSVPLVGNVEVELTYFTDPECQVPTRFSKIVTVNP